MTGPDDLDPPASPFLNVKDAEIVDGPGAVAEKVSDALRDADRFDLPHVKPPLSEALGKLEAAGGSNDAEGGTQDALAGNPVDVDELAGVLKPGAEGGQGC